MPPAKQGIYSESELCRMLSGLEASRFEELQHYAAERGTGLWSAMITREGFRRQSRLRLFRLKFLSLIE